MIQLLILEILFPLLLIIGYQTKICALILAIFTLATALIFHTDFSEGMQMMLFLKDIAIAGGFLVIASNEPKICSIDYYLKSKK